MEDPEFVEVTPLANPKGLKLLCHLCSLPARVQCPHCRVTYYCSVEDQKSDWDGIHSIVCPMMSSLRAPLTHANSEAERKQKRQLQQQTRSNIVKVALTEGRKQLHNGEPSLAFPPSLLALKLLTETHGPAHLELTPALLLLSQSSIDEGRQKEAENYLSQAQWTVLKANEAPPSLKSQLYRNLGLLATAKGDFTSARKHLAEDIFQSSIAYGPMSIQTVGGLFFLGNVFFKQSNLEVALSLHEKVVRIWMNHLEGILKEMDEAIHTPPSALSLPGETNQLDKVTTLNVAERVEARHHLKTILSLKEFHSLSSSSSLTLFVFYTLALLETVIYQFDLALTYCLEVRNHMVSDNENVKKDELERLQQLIPLLRTNQDYNNNN